MKKFIIIIFIVLCSCSEKDNNLLISGEVKDLKNTSIYLIDTNDKLVDSTVVTNEKFYLRAHANEPLEFTIAMGSKNSENRYSFISEPTQLIFTSSKDKFEYNGKIKNSLIHTEFEKIKNQLTSFDEKDLEMLKQQIEATVNKNQVKYDSLDDQRLKLSQKKTLFIVNYCLNNKTNIVSAYLASKYNEKISNSYKEKIYRNLHPGIRESFYGIELKSSF